MDSSVWSWMTQTNDVKEAISKNTNEVMRSDARNTPMTAPRVSRKKL